MRRKGLAEHPHVERDEALDSLLRSINENRLSDREATQVAVEAATYAHTCCDGHHEIGFNDPDNEYSERCPLCAEIDRLVDGVRDHMIAMGVPDSCIDGAGCDSDDPLDFARAEVTQAFSYLEDQSAERVTDARANAIRGFRDLIKSKQAEWEKLGDYGVSQGYLRRIEGANEILESLAKEEDDGPTTTS